MRILLKPVIIHYSYGLCFLIILLLNGCKREVLSPTCGSNDPLNELNWLQRQVDLQVRHNLDTASVIEYNYRGKAVFLVTNNPLTLNYGGQLPRQVFDCEGNSLSDFWLTPEYYEQFFKEARLKRRIWQKGQTPPKTSEISCGTKDPIKDLNFLARTVNFLTFASKKAEIYEYLYQNQTVYYAIKAPDAQITAEIAVLDCTGVNLTADASWNHSLFLRNASVQRLLWKR
jgi:hypothetical protein